MDVVRDQGRRAGVVVGGGYQGYFHGQENQSHGPWGGSPITMWYWHIYLEATATVLISSLQTDGSGPTDHVENVYMQGCERRRILRCIRVL